MPISTSATKRGISKIIEAGNHVVKINGISLFQPPFMEQDKGYYLRIEVETEPVEDENFEGFLIDKDDASKGRHKGQTGNIDVSRWGYKWKTKNGKDINRDQMIVNDINLICDAIESDWMPKHDGKFETIEQLVLSLNKDKPFKDKWIYVCIGGKGRMSPEGYPRYNLFLVDRDSIQSLRNRDKCTVFNEELHLEKPDGTIPPANPDATQEFNDVSKLPGLPDTSQFVPQEPNIVTELNKDAEIAQAQGTAMPPDNVDDLPFLDDSQFPADFPTDSNGAPF